MVREERAGVAVHGRTTTEDVTDISLHTAHAQLFYADKRTEQSQPTNRGENLSKHRALRV